MTLENDLQAFWKSYVPVLQAVECAQPIPESGRDRIKTLLSQLRTPPHWKVEIMADDAWYRNLLVSGVTIPAEGRQLILRPVYRKDGETIVWYSEERQLTKGSPRAEDDMSIYFEPQIKPAWEKDEGHRHADYRMLNSDIGRLTVMLEDGKGAFCSHERAKWLEDEDKKPRFYIGADGELKYREPQRANLIMVRLDYRHPTDDMTDEEMGQLMDEMWEGYTYITAIRFRARDVGSGEINKFLEHVGVKYPATR